MPALQSLGLFRSYCAAHFGCASLGSGRSEPPCNWVVFVIFALGFRGVAVLAEGPGRHEL